MAAAPPVVFITQAGTLDYTSAEQFGTLSALAHGELTFSAIELEVLHQIRRKLRAYRPGVDFVLLSGSPLTIAWVCLLISEMETGASRHRFLKWEKQTRSYTVYEITTPIGDLLGP